MSISPLPQSRTLSPISTVHLCRPPVPHFLRRRSAWTCFSEIRGSPAPFAKPDSVPPDLRHRSVSGHLVRGRRVLPLLTSFSAFVFFEVEDGIDVFLFGVRVSLSREVFLPVVPIKIPPSALRSSSQLFLASSDIRGLPFRPPFSQTRHFFPAPEMRRPFSFVNHGQSRFGFLQHRRQVVVSSFWAVSLNVFKRRFRPGAD